MISSPPKIALSLHIESSAYQQSEARAAAAAARNHGFDVSVFYADGDAITQSNQLLELIYEKGPRRPDVIVLEPVGTGLVRVAQEAAKAGMGWVVLNREVDYIGELRAISKAPFFAVTIDHLETGRIQGRQMNALVPPGGSAVLLQGPSSNPVAQARTKGLMETKDPKIKVRSLVGCWQETVAFEVMTSWLKIPSSSDLCLVAAQNDFMALGARKACSQMRGVHRASVKVKCIGCDGLEEHGRRWVSEGLLDATIVCPSLSALALDLLAKEFQGGAPTKPVVLAQPSSLPELGKMRPA